MRIALDYDGTYTEDPTLWDVFIEKALLRDHDVVMVTFRGDDTPIDHDPRIPVYYTAAHPKRDWMEGLGIDINVWIDDLPELITQKSNWTDEEREIWKQTQKRA